MFILSVIKTDIKSYGCPDLGLIACLKDFHPAQNCISESFTEKPYKVKEQSRYLVYHKNRIFKKYAVPFYGKGAASQGRASRIGNLDTRFLVHLIIFLRTQSYTSHLVHLK